MNKLKEQLKDIFMPYDPREENVYIITAILADGRGRNSRVEAKNVIDAINKCDFPMESIASVVFMEPLMENQPVYA